EYYSDDKGKMISILKIPLLRGLLTYKPTKSRLSRFNFEYRIGSR
ncbi:MAG: hypothetical protein ACI89S_002521, partial [Gammaproteobacteria bacterium]